MLVSTLSGVVICGGIGVVIFIFGGASAFAIGPANAKIKAMKMS
jgi:hypothetical protein